MAEYEYVTDRELTRIADEFRDILGTNDPLVFPEDFDKAATVVESFFCING